MLDSIYQKLRKGRPLVADRTQGDQHKSAIDLLRRIEWRPTCPFCHRLKAHGHSPSCDLGQFFLVAGVKVRFFNASNKEGGGRYVENDDS